ncbi:unnamed protein product [Strongylus vulgaris]|uniref:Phosphotyrosine protein phosphatase I domain-containing protein n=1 Tax=Strongylus vulgaris TaxID=40348 RepID=A0A3P7JGK2_STRVU|nr:unnamed protein product [Strongylus vulgaris]
MVPEAEKGRGKTMIDHKKIDWPRRLPCKRNICRSPIAEAVFLDIIKKRGLSDQWYVESAAIIDYHSGKPPDPRAMKTLEKFGITDYKHKARVTTTADIRDFDYIFGMDNSNIRCCCPPNLLLKCNLCPIASLSSHFDSAPNK